MTFRQPYGFTLVELIVVLALLATLLAFSIPVFKKNAIFSDRNQELGDLTGLITFLKSRAIKENQDFFLHIDTASGQTWITDGSMDEAARENARTRSIRLAGNLRVTDMEFAGTARHAGADNRENGSERVIRFNRNGHSDNVILHLDRGGSPVSLKIQPFLMEIEPVFERVSYDDCL